MNKIVLSALSLITGVSAGSIATSKVCEKNRKKTQQMSDKHLRLFLMMNQWVRKKQKGKNMAEYLLKEGYENVAVYGMSYAGETLLEELKDSEINVKYGIDQNADNIYATIEMVRPDDDLENIDCIIVTSVSFYEQIKATLEKKISCPIISLEDILDEM